MCRSTLVMVPAASSKLFILQVYVGKCEDYEGVYDLSLNNALYEMSHSVILNVYLNNNYELIDQL